MRCTLRKPLVGWSDGAIIGLDIAIHHPDRLTKLFAFAANSDTSGVKDVDKDPVFNAYFSRTKEEYKKLSLPRRSLRCSLNNWTRCGTTNPIS